MGRKKYRRFLRLFYWVKGIRMEKAITTLSRTDLLNEFERIGISKRHLQFSLKINKEGNFVYRTYNKELARKIITNFPYKVAFSKKPYGKCNFEYKFIWQ